MALGAQLHAISLLTSSSSSSINTIVSIIILIKNLFKIGLLSTTIINYDESKHHLLIRRTKPNLGAELHAWIYPLLKSLFTPRVIINLVDFYEQHNDHDIHNYHCDLMIMNCEERQSLTLVQNYTQCIAQCIVMTNK